MSSALDGILRGALGKLGGGSALGGLAGTLAPALIGMLAGGGLQKILGQFHSAGLAANADSWVGHGENQPVTAEHVQQALGADKLAEIAKQVGIPVDQVAGALAHALPQVVDHLTPDGKVPDTAEVDKALQATGT